MNNNNNTLAYLKLSCSFYFRLTRLSSHADLWTNRLENISENLLPQVLMFRSDLSKLELSRFCRGSGPIMDDYQPELSKWEYYYLLFLVILPVKLFCDLWAWMGWEVFKNN
ncbi:hypothetical protein GE061_004130 [Apolygus lucorum]|uniref:Uncharacterized protein n=1 Tax=Apolygus lucorum TaxID=248454 RepID=A0A8S9X2B2_APOLU|nr:hypothetical protein GE061_004130 [Apolygus lucorum]